jgi:Mce-associated membrane protein
MTPTWYDLLGVEPDASDEEIRAAWKSGIADLDPGDRRFRTLNEAAELLLDPATRAAYDAGLEPEADDKTQPSSPLTRQKLTGGAKWGRAVSDGSAETESKAPLPTHEEQGSRTTASRSVPAWLLAGLAMLTAAMVVAAGYLFSQPSDDAIADATSDAQDAAERAVVTILAYDYRTLDADQKAAGALMTPDYEEKYDELFEVIKQNAEAVKPVVTVEVVASGIVRSGENRVDVLVFVNRPTTNAQRTEPVESRDQVVMTMVESGDDWLVDCLDTNQLAGGPPAEDQC